jgi:hypothetical protein
VNGTLGSDGTGKLVDRRQGRSQPYMGIAPYDKKQSACSLKKEQLADKKRSCSTHAHTQLSKLGLSFLSALIRIKLGLSFRNDKKGQAEAGNHLTTLTCHATNLSYHKPVQSLVNTRTLTSIQ